MQYLDSRPFTRGVKIPVPLPSEAGLGYGGVLGPASRCLVDHLNADPAMTVSDAAVYLNVNEKTLYRLAQGGDLPGFKVAGAWRFRPEHLELWVEAQRGTEASRRGQQSLAQVWRPIQRARVAVGKSAS